MNVDTPYSFAWLDLRAEPVVLSLPAFGPDRYVSVELIDLYTYIVGYISAADQRKRRWRFSHRRSRAGMATRRKASKLCFIRPPSSYWRSTARSFNQTDIDNVHALQDRYQVQELSTYQGIATPPVEPPFAKIKPIDVRKESESPQFFAILNAMLAYMPMLNEEAGLRSRLVKIGVVSGAHFRYIR